MHLTMFFTLLVLTTCAAVCGHSDSKLTQCSASMSAVPGEIKTQSLMQAAVSKKPNVTMVGFLTWESRKVEESNVVLPQMRTPPSCTVSPLTNACLPSFMVIGTQKCATSSLYNIISTHPQVEPAYKKELLWFNGNFEKLRCNPPDSKPDDEEFEEYLTKFPRLPSNTTALTGEFSATYMHCWCCPRAMQRLMPDLRLITQLRDPIERARSRWNEQHSWAKKITTYSSFEEYVERKLPHLEACLEKAGNSLEDKTHCAAKSNILGLSVYDSVIKLWQQHFQPNNFLVTYLEQLAKDPQSVVSSIHRHLGIADLQYPGDLLHKKYNAEGHYGWQRSLQNLQIGNSTALEKLYMFYRPHMQELKAMADAGHITPLPKSWRVRWNL
uniref:Sulfotransferase domain-containing protein n=1 Tax=Alexandrium andersonii TaxID=327968 RepID=A0A7S2HU49_9DINO|mmetsp:Transcript_75101/g.168165  ORF Transcript_75101/g.168165 Transcript_75101/m.168165 type:complete len:383 (+) Transcript_75101:93-1241(+)